MICRAKMSAAITGGEVPAAGDALAIIHTTAAAVSNTFGITGLLLDVDIVNIASNVYTVNMANQGKATGSPTARGEATRERLLRAAVELVEQGGFEALTMRALARRCGVSHNAAYRHFADREAILVAVGEQGFRELTRRMREALAAESDTEQAAIAVGCAYIRFALDHPVPYRLMFGDGLHQVSSRKALLGAGLASFQTVLDVLADLLDTDGARSRPPGEVAVAAWSLIHGFASLVLSGLIPLDRDDTAAIEQHMRRLHEVFLHGAG
ncbi:MAG: TetR/AcrR family transcriptional regulator [Candidatus Dadabacteria bacterium]|nr:MAG: TetR/AcrR family transcriptional regulator [Candidatus Dadabacteria bacterium]